jgi:hypothetical protein
LGKLPSNAFKSLSAKDAEENLPTPLNKLISHFLKLCCCRFEGADSTPLEGFDADALDEILGLRAKDLEVALCFL